MSPLLTRNRILGAAVESEIGAAEDLAAGDAAFNAFEVRIAPEIAVEQRPGQGGFSPLASVPGARGGQLTFKTELYGTAALPDWATVLLPACAVPRVGSSRVFSPSSAAPGDGPHTITIGVWEDGVLKSLRGAMGNLVLRFPAGRRALAEWDFRGIWIDPTDEDLPTPAYPTASPLRMVSSGLAIGAWTPIVAEFVLDLGNEVLLREDVSDASGYKSALIGGRRVHGTIDPESGRVAAHDSHGDWMAGAEAALAATLGSGDNGLTIDIPKFQITKIDEGDRGGNQVDQVEWQANRSAAAGDDELTLTFTED